MLIASAGLGLALLATIFAYYAGAQVLGEHYDLAIQPLLRAAAQLPHDPGAARVPARGRSATAPRSACSRCTPGCPTRTRRRRPRCPRCCPDRCSRSASTRSCASTRSPPRRWAAASRGTRCWPSGSRRCCSPSLYVFGQRDVKRLLAYSSVEHMGILAIGVSFGAPVALAGVLLHVLAHAAAKGNAFMGAGVFTRQVRHQAGRRDARRPAAAAVERPAVPARGLRAVRAAAVRASSAANSRSWPAASSSGGYAAAAVLVVLVTLAFFGLATSATSDAADSGAGADAPGTTARQARGEPSAWMVVPVLAGARGAAPARDAPARRADRPDQHAARRSSGARMTITSTGAGRRGAVGRARVAGSAAASGSPACPRPAATARPSRCRAHVAAPRPASTRWRRRCRPAPASYPALTPRLGAAFWYERRDPRPVRRRPRGPSPARPARQARRPGGPRAAHGT